MVELCFGFPKIVWSNPTAKSDPSSGRANHRRRTRPPNSPLLRQAAIATIHCCSLLAEKGGPSSSTNAAAAWPNGRERRSRYVARRSPPLPSFYQAAPNPTLPPPPSHTNLLPDFITITAGLRCFTKLRRKKKLIHSSHAVAVHRSPENEESPPMVACTSPVISLASL
nr:hypothetical protein Iba_chr12eCG7970 [Ipomoea batatas]